MSPEQHEPALEGPGLARVSWWRRGAALYRLLLLGLVVWAVVWGLRAVWSFTIDDAGISYAYARHIADGHGPVAAVGGPRIEGYSNPLWVFLLVPVHWLGLPIPVFAKAFGACLFAAALAAGMSYMLRVERRTWRSFGASEACFAIVSALCLEVAVWVPAGLENALFGALLLGMIALDARESEDPTAFGSSGLCAFGLAITRPEAALYVGALLLVKTGAALRKREPVRQVVTALCAFVIPFVLYHVGHFLVFGELLPNTYRAKPGGSGWLRGLQYLMSTARESGLLYAVPLALVGLYGRLRLRLLIGWTWLAGMFFVLYAGGDWMPHGRFLSLFAPVVVVLAGLGLCRLAQVLAWLARARLPREAVAFGLACLVSLAWGSYQLPRLDALRQKGWCHFCERVADTDRVRELAKRAGLSSHSLVTHDFGGPSWLSDEGFYPIDFLGLCDRSIVSIRANRARGGVRNELRLYQYLIHEQPIAPSWVLVPPNFWPGFDRSPEYRSDYYALEARQLPRARRDSFFALHRGELVDYFPPVSNAARRSLTEQLDLVGFAVFAGSGQQGENVPVGAGANVSVLVSVVPRARLLGTEQLSVRVEAGAQAVESSALRLDRKLAGVARQLGTGEPLSIELSLQLPPGPDAAYRLSLAVAHAGGKRRSAAREAVVVPLGELPVGTPASRLERSLPRYPAALPAPTYPELRELRPSVTRVIEQNRSEGRAAPHDEPLEQRLVDLGQKLEAQGQLEQAYLAYVWATQVDRSAWTPLAETIHRLRPTGLGDEHAMEVALLRQYYGSGTTTELARLVAFYLAAQRPLEARYLLERWPASAVADADPLAASRVRFDAALAATDAEHGSAGDILAEVAVDPLGGALDFEAAELQTWEGQHDVFRAGPRDDRHGLPGLRGYHGSGLLSSTAGGNKTRGTVLSPEFRLTGRLMTLLVGGGSAKQKVGVELLVDGKIVLRAAGDDSDNLTPVFWNVAAFEGKSARLRVFDQNPRQHVLLDRVLCWL